MSITVDEFLRLKQICEPRRSLDLTIPLTDELINEAARRLPSYLVCRLEAAKNVPVEEWPTIQLPRKDGLGNITPNGVAQAVRHVFWKLARAVERVAREKVVAEPATVRRGENGTAQCPWCGGILVLPKQAHDEG
jgi:hypothetical protein